MEKELTTINVSLPVPLRSYLEERVKLDGYGSISDLVRALIREEEKRQPKEHHERRFLSILDEGDVTPVTKEGWEEIKNIVSSKIAARNK